MPAYKQSRNFKFLLRIPEIAEIRDFFKTLHLLEFLFDHSELFTGETRHIVPAYNKAGIFKFLLRIAEIAEIPDFFKTLLLEFLFNHSEIFTGETRHIVPACNKPEFHISA